MDGEESSSDDNWFKNLLKSLNKFENVLLLFYLELLIIYLILFCNVLELSYLNFYSIICVYLSFAIIVIFLLFSILQKYWKNNNTIKTTRKKTVIRMIYSQQYLSILCLIICLISFFLIYFHLDEIQCKRDDNSIDFSSDFSSVYSSVYSSDYISDTTSEKDKPEICIEVDKKSKMQQDLLVLYFIIDFSLIVIIVIICKNKSKFFSELDMVQEEEKKPEISSEVQNNGKNFEQNNINQQNNISSFQVNQSNITPNTQTVDVNSQVILEKKHKKNKRKAIKVNDEKNNKSSNKDLKLKNKK